MGKEAYQVSYDKVNYHAPIPQGHDRNDVLKKIEEGIMNNMLRYLGEYRLGVKFDEFFYRQETDEITGETYLASNTQGPVRDIFRKAILAREEQGLSVRREVAECLGFEKLEKQMIFDRSNSLFIWASPPGTKADGYGEYSFTFIGQAVKDPVTLERRIRVISYRNIFSQQEHRNYLVYFDKRAKNFNSDVDFLANPIVFSPTEYIQTPEDILRIIGEQEKISTDWRRRLSILAGPLIERYIELVKREASDEELTEIKYALENYTIAMKDQLEGNMMIVNEGPISSEELKHTIEIWGRHAPVQVAGSCGSTLMEHHKEFNKSWEYHTGNCVVCGAEGVAVGPCSICKACEKKFDEEESVMHASYNDSLIF